MPDRPTVLTLVGPTGAGKTAALLRLAERAPVQVLSADSVQVIRGFDVGSAKPSAAEQARLPHHLIDLIDPQERYDAGRFRHDAEAVRRRLGNAPLVATAGTGLYLQAWSAGMPELPTLPEPERSALAEHVRTDPAAAHAELQRLDPARAAALHPNDWRRIARALEVVHASGRPMSAALAAAPQSAGPRLELFGIWAEGPAYEHALRRRVEAMLAAGWIDEVAALMAAHGPDLPGLEAVGYAQVAAHLRGELPKADLAAAIHTATRQYAKRQRTWFKRLSVRWFGVRPGGVPPGLVDALRRALGA